MNRARLSALFAGPWPSRALLLFFALLILTSGLAQAEAGPAKALPSEARTGPTFAISFADSVHDGPLDGRLVLLLARDEDPAGDPPETDRPEPRFQLGSGLDTAVAYGVDVDGLEPGQTVVIDASVFGFPVASMADLPAGDYRVQAVLHRYETFQLTSGHTVKLPMDRGEGQQWNRAPGNLYSTPKPLRIDAGSDRAIEVVLDQRIAKITTPADTEYVRHIRIESALLSAFWGRPMHLGAHVLVPKGFDEHPEARYPLISFHGHFPSEFGGFRPEPPDPDLACERSERFGLDCYNRTVQQEAHDFYQAWTGDDFPRFLIIEIQHPTPYYDDSYAVNSANLGPYGDAITYELIPAIEKQFRGIGAGWARYLYGGSTGGWEALAAQVFYPDEYGGTFAACPDPIDFRAFTLIDLYEDANAYYEEGTFKRVARPGHRDALGRVDRTIEDDNALERVLGSKGRSGQQYDIWQAVYSPMGADGYPQPIWNKATGVIDHEVAAYWREHYDLRHILERDWQTLGPKLRGKIHIYCGDMDNYYLNNAVYRMEDFLASTTDPPYDGEIDYGDRAEHCWNGDHEHSNAISRLRYNTMYVSKILKLIHAQAPPGADLTSWRY